MATVVERGHVAMQLGDYELLTRLATGGMAEIYAARSRSAADRIVIIKRMLPQYAGSAEFVDMFLDEGRMIALLRHPNIVRMYDFGFEGDQPYLAMEYLHGVDVRTILRTMKAGKQVVPLAIALTIAAAVSAALHHAHEALTIDGQPMELVHRDVSPQNVVVTFAGVTKLIDFGIAKSRGRLHETKGGGLKGKIAYMSPEQIRGQKLDRRTDVYAVGVMLYELLTGRRPYRIPGRTAEDQGEFSLMMAIVGHEIVLPTKLRPDLPRNLERLVLSALAPNVADRFATAAALQGAIKDAVRELGLVVGERPLAAFLARTFGERDQQWHAMLGRPDEDLATHIQSVEHIKTKIDGALDPDFAEERDAPPTVALAARRSLDELTVITVDPRIDESFRGPGPLTGTVVFDLGQVERVSSFGVRAWLELVDPRNGQRNGRRDGGQDEVAVYLARCSEPVMSQLTMIRGFAGKAHVVSFLAPYLCGQCSHTFRHSFDCERDAMALRGPVAPAVPCPRCTGPAALDDDVSYFVGVQAFLGRVVPPLVRATIDKLEAAAQHGGLIDKTVLGQVTRLRLLQPIDRSFRWGRVLDGLEGVVELDVTAAQLDATAVEAMRAALRNLDPAVTAVSVAGVPGAFAHAGAIARCTIASYVVDGRCTTCRARRSALIGSDDLHAMLAAGRVDVRCRRCDTSLEQEAAPPAREVVLGPQVTPPLREVALAPQVTPRRRGGLWRIIAVAVLAVVAGGIAARVVWHPRRAARDAAQVRGNP